jgi:hypothetical protein
MLQNSKIITSETNYPSRKYTITQLSVPVKLPKTTQYVQETPSTHPFTLGKTVTQLFFPVIQTVPQPQHIKHTNTYSQRQTLKSLTRIPQRPRPLNTTIVERATKRDNIIRGKWKSTANPKETTATKRTAHTSPTTTSPKHSLPQATPPTVPPLPPCSPGNPEKPPNKTLTNNPTTTN